MTPNRLTRTFAWSVVTMVLVAIVLLVWFVPVVAAVLFVGFVTTIAVAEGKAYGFWRGVKVFLKEKLFEW